MQHIEQLPDAEVQDCSGEQDGRGAPRKEGLLIVLGLIELEQFMLLDR